MNENSTHAYEIARDMLADAAPGVLTMSDVAESIATRTGVTRSTARNRLREAVEEGKLLELTPKGYWGADLPGAAKAGLNLQFAAHGRHIIISRDPDAYRPSRYGPGRTTYLITPERAAEIVKGYIDEDVAKKDAQKAADKAEKAAVRAEIKRRAPGMLDLMRRLEFLMHYPRPDISSARARLHQSFDVRKGHTPDNVEKWDLILDIDAWGERSTGVLRAILEAGIQAYLDDQPLVVCAHCETRIASLTDVGDEIVWWHVLTTNFNCKDAETLAEPKPACPNCTHPIDRHTARVGEDTGVCASCSCMNTAPQES